MGLGSDGDTASSGFTARMWSDGSWCAEEVRLALLVYGGGSLPVLVGCSDESGGVIFVLDVSLSASVFLAVLRRALVVLINTVANLETLYAGGMIQVSVTVRVVSVGGFDRRSSMAPRWLLAVLPRLAPPLRYFLSIYLREKATAFLFGVLSLVWRLNGQRVAMFQPVSCTVRCGQAGVHLGPVWLLRHPLQVFVLRSLKMKIIDFDKIPKPSYLRRRPENADIRGNEVVDAKLIILYLSLDKLLVEVCSGSPISEEVRGYSLATTTNTERLEG
ncbi:hypothetical protein F2Q70_00015325 [Brassica cretica]|uniref:Uncharacterized protein n=1 Tax=Brassica cretica TaxID=69181 RepID=A0A8S9I367_BRACR|nr:hypothetical protein F2Q70_00015325 [Brassica cretica]